ncbi:MAG: ABC transporter ATP-binding protein [Spirochaetes bacterium GWD1_27_9]|nr:MAG: ABC transporter ATP-binding protein [Spirochaetes bacterium GWB1_27_13]OHD42399.1 MAG: ABC transporter ATP-binding protein [Spirochaetes bacterium GWD1_27_9]
MISTSGITVRYGKRILFEEVTIKFAPGNCYGLIGANGSGKSTFLKVLSGEIEADSGDVITAPGERIAVLKQDHFQFDETEVLKTVIMGHKKLIEIMEEKDILYAKPDFSEEDGVLISELEGEFAELNGWNAETDAAQLLSGLGIKEEFHTKKMKELTGSEKVRVLLAQALFGNPDILLLDEPTNHLDVDSISWLEDFLYNFENTVIVVSHDRHFLNRVCTHIADIDYGKIQLFVGNYDFWYHSSQLIMKQLKEDNKKKEAKISELQEFIRRFSSNASKAKQATSRKKEIEKLTLEDIRPSSRRYPYIAFKSEREAGKEILTIENLTKTVEGRKVLNNINLIINKGDKIAFVGSDGVPKTALFQILMGELTPDSGTYKWGQTITVSHFPKDNSKYFSNDYNLVDWLRQYSKDQEETYIRSFLGRMLFSGDETLKKSSVLSGGEKVRCMLSKMMLSNANFYILDEPTNHLDLESITSLNEGMEKYTGGMMFATHDHELISTVANRIIEITPKGIIDKLMNYDDYLENADVKKLRKEMYNIN